MDDFRIRQLKNDIIECINKAALPLEVKRLVLADVYSETSRAADNAIVNFIATEKNKVTTETNPEKSPE